MLTTATPTRRDTIKALRLVGRTLDVGCAHQRGGRFYFDLGGGWLLGLSPDDAGRFRVSALYGSTEVATLWSLAGDHDRLAALVLGLRNELAALHAA
jgi:hypothetical protein